jgi:hypothetical protein
MARFEYRGRECDEVFEISRPMAEADCPALFPSGHDGAVRLLSVFASTGRASGGGLPCGPACACHPG